MKKLPHTLPLHVRAAIEALQFAGPDNTTLQQLDEDRWSKLFEYCDRAQLTLPLALRCCANAPKSVVQILERKFADNAERWRRIRDAYIELADPLESAGIEFIVLKGFAHCPQFAIDPRYRAQYDFDLLIPRGMTSQATTIAGQLGYEPLGSVAHLPTDHLPTMIRKTGWAWRGNYFDPDLPPSVELHFRLWDERTEKISIAGLDQFWGRRERRCVDGLWFLGLDPRDSLAYASLHAVRHLLRGDLRPSHLYEIAYFLDHRSTDSGFWSDWHIQHDHSLLRLQAVCFNLARYWFGCQISEQVLAEVERLPRAVHRWFENYAFSPLESQFRANKDELWLHLSLLDSAGARASVLRRRIVPLSFPGPVDAVHLKRADLTWWISMRSHLRRLQWILRRVGHHAWTVPTVALGFLRWSFADSNLGEQYWRFFVAAGLYDFGLFIYFLLYNLYLLQLGFGEKFLGFVSSAMLAGSIAGAIPAGVTLQRLGVQRTLLIGFTAVAALSAVRATVSSGPVLLALAFLTGVISSVWAVAISPAVAQLTNPKNRSLGFSLVFSSGIGIGVLGGLAGGRLPGLFASLHGERLNALHYREALLSGCAIVSLAAWPLARLTLGRVHGPAGLRWPGRDLSKFLAAAALWNFGTGAFNPFFGAFFHRMRVPVDAIGAIFSAAQLAQVGAVLLAPLIFRRFGLIRGISGMQVATGLALLALMAGMSPVAAAIGYGGYMVLEYMSEPGLYTMLMESVPDGERNTASALSFLVASAAQALAAALSGVVIERFGYPLMLISAALICMAAGLLFHSLFEPKPRSFAIGSA